jgi:predicted RNA binding protein YcfA (HicA-like mRNA interferase family)
MPKLYRSREILHALGKAGFVEVSQKGSHIKLRGIRDGRLHTVIVPNHKQIAFGTFTSILSQASMMKKEFESYC